MGDLRYKQNSLFAQLSPLYNIHSHSIILRLSPIKVAHYGRLSQQLFSRVSFAAFFVFDVLWWRNKKNSRQRGVCAGSLLMGWMLAAIVWSILYASPLAIGTSVVFGLLALVRPWGVCFCSLYCICTYIPNLLVFTQLSRILDETCRILRFLRSLVPMRISQRCEICTFVCFCSCP